MNQGEWKWQFDPLDPNGRVEVTQNNEVIFVTQTLKNAQRLCQMLNSYQDMYEALKEIYDANWQNLPDMASHIIETVGKKALMKAEGK